MEKDVRIEGQAVRLRPLSEKDLGGAYLGWLNDPKVNRHSYRQHEKSTEKSMHEYYERQKKSNGMLVLAIEERGGGRHIGNVALQSISMTDKSAEIAILLGEKEFWGKGIGTECFGLMIDHAFGKLGLRRVYCGAHAENIGMQRVAESCGMRTEGVRREAMCANGKFSDVIEYGLLKSEWDAGKLRRKEAAEGKLAAATGKKPRIVATIEARMGSSRLPGKSMAEILGKPLLWRIVERLRNSRHVDDICVATTTSKKDDVIAEYCRRNGIQVFRGSEEDVLGRVVGAAQSAQADIIVEVTGDMAVVDWGEIDRGIEKYLEGGWDIVTNTRVAAYPQGIDVQVYSAGLLGKAAQKTDAKDDREHVTLYIYKHPEKFRVFHMMPAPENYDPKLRLMVDYPEDLEFMIKIYGKLYHKNPKFLTADIMALLKKEPELRDIVKNIS